MKQSIVGLVEHTCGLFDELVAGILSLFDIDYVDGTVKVLKRIVLDHPVCAFLMLLPVLIPYTIWLTIMFEHDMSNLYRMLK